MPPDEEFLAFWNEWLAQPRKTRPDLKETLHKRWPVKADRIAYYRWSGRRADERLYARQMTNISPEELTEMLATMNYNNEIARGKLVNVLERSVVPWLPVGSDRAGGIYRIVPGAHGLLPDQQDPKTNRELVSMNVLGINTNVQPAMPFRSLPNLTSLMTRTLQASYFTRSEILSTGVVILRTYEDAANGTWFPTRFHAVMRFERNGAANGVFVIYDFYPEDEYLQERRKLDDRDWGYLPSGLSDQPISIAKIANKITDLRFGRTFDFVGPLDYPVELVRAMKTPEDTIIRVTVA
ncbi:MAG: hypothetical protein M1839_006270 [Geoglossum umbratile]|nr:MAG: hypothetical protein M1839_006270 [Geoglossum umbratile]